MLMKEHRESSQENTFFSLEALLSKSKAPVKSVGAVSLQRRIHSYLLVFHRKCVLLVEREAERGRCKVL